MNVRVYKEDADSSAFLNLQQFQQQSSLPDQLNHLSEDSDGQKPTADLNPNNQLLEVASPSLPLERERGIESAAQSGKDDQAKLSAASYNSK